MTTTISDIRFIVERDIEDVLDFKSVVDWCNLAQTDFALRVFVPDVYNLPINTTDCIYTVPADMRTIRMIRRQSDLDEDINRPYHPVYSLYNGEFQVPAPFDKDDILVIDYYRTLRIFDSQDDPIDLEDRYATIYTSYCESRYYRMASTIKLVGADFANLRYQDSIGIYQTMKKQVTDAYTNSIGIQKPVESGW